MNELTSKVVVFAMTTITEKTIIKNNINNYDCCDSVGMEVHLYHNQWLDLIILNAIWQQHCVANHHYNN